MEKFVHNWLQIFWQIYDSKLFDDGPIPRYSVVYQAGVPPRLRKKVCEQLLQEISYAFRRSDRFILLLDEFDTSVELTRLKRYLARYNCIIVLASNNSHLSKLLEPTEMFELKGLTIPESISVLQNISKRISKTDSPLENNGLPMDILNLSNVLLKYSNNRTGAFISLATKLLLTGPPYDINKVLLCGPDSNRSMSSIKTIQRIIRVKNGNIEIIQRNLTWI